MKKDSTLLLKTVVFGLGFLVMGFNLAAVRALIIGDDLAEFSLVLAVLMISTLPFFYGLYLTFKLLKYIDVDKGFSELSVKALKSMKNCALIVSLIYVLSMPFVYFVADREDAPGLVAIGLILVFIAVVIATFTAVLEKLVRNGLDIKSENDLTV